MMVWSLNWTRIICDYLSTAFLSIQWLHKTLTSSLLLVSVPLSIVWHFHLPHALALQKIHKKCWRSLIFKDEYWLYKNTLVLKSWAGKICFYGIIILPWIGCRRGLRMNVWFSTAQLQCGKWAMCKRVSTGHWESSQCFHALICLMIW